MATTFAFELNSKANRYGTYAVYLRITQNRKLTRQKTSIAVRKSDFNKKAKNGNWIRTSNPDHAVLNEALRKEILKAEETYRDLKEDGLASSEKIIAELKAGEKSLSFVEYARKRTQEEYDRGSIRNWKKYNGFCNKLEAYLTSIRRKDLLMAEVTPAFLRKFEVYLGKLPNEREPEKTLHPNTIEVLFNIFKAIINRAITIDGLMRYDKNPFMKFSYKGVQTTKEKLDWDEVRKMMALDLEPGTLLWHSRNCFLFSMYCAGIRVGDLLQLRWCNVSKDGRLSYEMDKNHKLRDIILVPEASEILSHYYSKTSKPTDYIFPLLDSTASYAVALTGKDKDTMSPDLKKRLLSQVGAKNALLNKYVKKVAEMAGVEKTVSMHISRHTFAKMAKTQGLDNLLVKSMLAHSKLETTERYMGEFDTAETDNALKKIFATPEDKQKQELLSLLASKSPEEIAAFIEQLKG